MASSSLEYIVQSELSNPTSRIAKKHELFSLQSYLPHQVLDGVVPSVSCDVSGFDTAAGGGCALRERVFVTYLNQASCGTAVTGWTPAVPTNGDDFFIQYHVPAEDILGGTAGTATCTVTVSEFYSHGRCDVTPIWQRLRNVSLARFSLLLNCWSQTAFYPVQQYVILAPVAKFFLAT